MFNQGLYPFIPPLKGAKVLIAVLWSLGVLFVAIGLHATQSGDAPVVSPAPIVSPASRGQRETDRQLSEADPLLLAHNSPPTKLATGCLL